MKPNFPNLRKLRNAAPREGALLPPINKRPSLLHSLASKRPCQALIPLPYNVLKMSDNEDNLFADSSGDESDDTADLFAQSGAKKKAASPSKKKTKKDEGDDLFDSDSDDDEDAKPAPKKKELSKREKMEALARKKRQDDSPRKKKAPPMETEAGAKKEDGYDSEDSVDSAQIERTQDDINFIDTTGEDEDAVKELYAAQHFDAEEDDMEDHGPKKKRKYRNDEAEEEGKEPDNPLVAAMMRLKKKQRKKKSVAEMEDEVKSFIGRMEAAAEADEQAFAERKPGLNRLQMLSEVVDMMKKRDYTDFLIDMDLLTVVRRWIQPLPNGQLGNVTVRQKLLEAVANMPGIHPNALKRSELGKTVMVLHKHPQETPAMKRQTRELIEQWSRGIFQKSGNMRDLEHVHHSRGEGSLGAVRRPQSTAATSTKAAQHGSGDLKSLLTSGKRGGDALSASVNRVRVPFSKGFAYSVRPTNRSGDIKAASAKESHGGLKKRMLDKAKKVGKNQRSANISIEGRRTKG